MPDDLFISVSNARIVAEPELKFLSSGVPVFNARVAVNHRRKSKQTGEWEDSGTTWLTLVAFGQLAEESAEHLQQGDLVTGSGEFQAREWETKEGEKRITNEVTMRHLGRDLIYPRKDERQPKTVKSTAEYDSPPFLSYPCHGN